MSGSPIAEAVVQNPPPTASCETSRARQMALSAIIFDDSRPTTAVILHRMWIEGTEFNWSKMEIAA